MKKFMIMALAALSVMGAGAQELQEPNRMIIAPKAGSQKSYAIENIDQLAFRRIEGRVAADVSIVSVSDVVGSDKPVTVAVKRTPACNYFKFSLVPAAVIGTYDNAATAAYVDMNETTQYFDDFTSGEISGITLEPGTNYAVVTAAYDNFGTLCESSKAVFTTPSAELVGNPSVACEVTSVGKYSFTVKFTPNADCAGYACVQFDGVESFEGQFNMYAPMMGFANYGQMIERWGIKETKETTKTWSDDINPGNQYFVAVQCWDVNHNYAPVIFCYVDTDPQGGEGVAACDVDFGGYEEEVDQEGKTHHWQNVSLSMNNQTWRYRFGVFLKSDYDKYGQKAIHDDVKSYPDNFMAESIWWKYDDFSNDYDVAPNTEFVVVVCAQNAKEEWSEVKEFWYTTPDKATKVSAAPMRAAVKSETKLSGVKVAESSDVKINKGVAPKGLRLTELR